MTCLDYWQVILSGTYRALGEMEKFSKFNFVTYFVIILGLSIYFSFYVGNHIDIMDKNQIPKKGLGLMGTWYAFIIGLSFQFFCEVIILIFVIDWKESAKRAHIEMCEDHKESIEDAIEEALSARGGGQTPMQRLIDNGEENLDKIEFEVLQKKIKEAMNNDIMKHALSRSSIHGLKHVKKLHSNK